MCRTAFLLALVSALAAAAPLFADKEEESPPGAEAFLSAVAEATTTAHWLDRYDRVAWWSTDVVLKLPKERLEGLKLWFAYEADDGWHAVYGHLAEDASRFVRVLHYRVKSRDEIEELEERESADFDVPFALALEDSRKRLVATEAGKRARFNPYVRETASGIEVWTLPQVAQDWKIVYGITFCWKYSEDGKEFLEQKTWDYGAWSTPPDRSRNLLIGTTDFEAPSPGDLFVALRFGDLFKGIAVRSRDYVSVRMPQLKFTDFSHVYRPFDGKRFPPEQPAKKEPEAAPKKPEKDGD